MPYLRFFLVRNEEAGSSNPLSSTIFQNDLGCANDVLNLFHLAPYKINSLVFFGPYRLLIGYLIFRSTFLPRILGVLMMFAGLGWLLFLSPLANHLSTYLKVLGFLAELSLCLWLLVMGVNVQQWKEQASAVVE